MQATFLILAVAAGSIAATAAPIYNTGVDNAFGLLPAGSGEIHYVVTGPGTDPYTTTVVASNPGWYAVPPGSIGTATANWITANTTGFASGESSAQGGLYPYTYTGVFSGTTLSGNWAADNCGTMLIDSIAVSTIGGGADPGCVPTVAAFQTLTAFNVTGLSDTTHSLQFQVYNVLATPTGLFVDNLSTGGGVPEPSSVLLALTGFGLLGLGIRRRQAAK